jgi:hypothetical protein
MSFYPDPMHELTPLRSGRIIAADLGPTLWRGKWSLVAVDADAVAEVRAWYASLLSYQPFYGYDKLREYPRNYINGWGSLFVGSNPFAGYATLASVTGGVTAGLENLPIGFVLKNGDYFSFDYGTDSRALHMVVSGGTADAQGELTVTVSPAIRTGWEATAPATRTINFYKPSAKMIIVPGSWSDAVEPPALGRFSCEAVQTL